MTKKTTKIFCTSIFTQHNGKSSSNY